MTENGLTETTTADDRCSRVGHDWVDAPDAAIVARRCVHCPAIGAPCPECGGGGRYFDSDVRADRHCNRCRGTGTIEVVEVSLGEIDRLRRTQARFGWLLEEFAYLTDTRPDALLHEIDALIGMGASRGKIRGRPIAELARAAQRKALARQNPDEGQYGERPRSRTRRVYYS